MDDPAVTIYSDDRILQRLALATLYFSTGGDSWNDSSFWLDCEVHECQWFVHSYEKVLAIQQLTESMVGDIFPEPEIVFEYSPEADEIQAYLGNN
jgi:hypothetical protein